MKPARDTSEAELMPRRRSEDAEAWREIVRRFAPYVHAVTRANELPEDAAAAAFHDVFASVWTEIDRLEGDDALRARVVELAEDVAAERREGDPIPEETLRWLRQALGVQEAVRGLPASQRELLQRSVIDGQDDAAIAATLELGEDTVAEQLTQARLRVRARVRRRALNVQEERLRPHDRA